MEARKHINMPGAPYALVIRHRAQVFATLQVFAEGRHKSLEDYLYAASSAPAEASRSTRCSLDYCMWMHSSGINLRNDRR
jgi:hypothetical protein